MTITRKQFKGHYFIVDWSWALINAITNTFNSFSISEYIEENYNFVEKGIPLKKPITPVFICCSHFVNIISIQIKKKLPNIDTEHRNLILDFFCAILSAKSVGCADELFQQLCLIMCSPNITRSSKYAYETFIKTLGKIYSNNFVDSENAKSEDTINSNINVWPENITNPYFLKYNRIYLEVISKIERERGSKPNKFYCREFIQFIIKKYFSYIILWANFFSNMFGVKGNISNAIIENWFHVVKNHYLKNKRMKIGRVVNILKFKCEQKLKSIQMPEPLVSTPKNRKRKLLPDNMLYEEQWNKKLRPVQSPKHFGKKVLTRYKDKKAFELDPKNRNRIKGFDVQQLPICRMGFRDFMEKKP